jgi:hypothetical protein
MSRIIKTTLLKKYAGAHGAEYFNPLKNKDEDVKVIDIYRAKNPEKRIVGFRNRIHKVFEGTLRELGDEMEELMNGYNGSKENSPSITNGVFRHTEVTTWDMKTLPFRRQSNMAFCDIICLDFDNTHSSGVVSKDEFLKKLDDSGYEYLFHESYKSTIQNFRGRAIFVLDKSVDNIHAYDHIYKNFAQELLGDELFNQINNEGARTFIDLNCSQANRLLYLGKSSNIKKRIYKPGKCVDSEQFNYLFIDPLKQDVKDKSNGKVRTPNEISRVNWKAIKRNYKMAKATIKASNHGKVTCKKIIEELCRMDHLHQQKMLNLKTPYLAINQTEPEWMASIRAFLFYAQVGGPKLKVVIDEQIHAWSMAYPSYTHKDTEPKINQCKQFILESYQFSKQAHVDLDDLTPEERSIQLPSSKTEKIPLEEARINIRKHTLKNFTNGAIFLNRSKPGVGKTITTLKTFPLQLKKNPDSAFCFISSQYSALDVAYQEASKLMALP